MANSASAPLPALRGAKYTPQYGALCKEASLRLGMRRSTVKTVAADDSARPPSKRCHWRAQTSNTTDSIGSNRGRVFVGPACSALVLA